MRHRPWFCQVPTCLATPCFVPSFSLLNISLFKIPQLLSSFPHTNRSQIYLGYNTFFFLPQPGAAILVLMKSRKIQDGSTQISWDPWQNPNFTSSYETWGIWALSSFSPASSKVVRHGRAGWKGHWRVPLVPLSVCHNILRQGLQTSACRPDSVHGKFLPHSEWHGLFCFAATLFCIWLAGGDALGSLIYALVSQTAMQQDAGYRWECPESPHSQLAAKWSSCEMEQSAPLRMGKAFPIYSSPLFGDCCCKTLWNTLWELLPYTIYYGVSPHLKCCEVSSQLSLWFSSSCFDFCQGLLGLLFQSPPTLLFLSPLHRPSSTDLSCAPLPLGSCLSYLETSSWTSSCFSTRF